MKVQSSNLDTVNYDVKTCVLRVRFLNQTEYLYRDVPPHIWQEFRRRKAINESVGRWFNQAVKGQYAFEKVS